MKQFPAISHTIIILLIVRGLISCAGKKEGQPAEESPGNLKIGWATADLTPDKPVLLAGHGSYLPTARAVAGGSYGAAATAIGPEGGQELVEKTLEMINAVWQKN